MSVANSPEHNVYGGMSGTRRQQNYYKAFKERYHQIEQTQKGWVDEALRRKEIRLVSGLIAYFPDTKITNTGFVTHTQQIYNLPIQSFATADIVPIGVTCMWHRMRAEKLQSFIINTVHDSALSEIHPDEVDDVSRIAKQAMEDDVKEVIEKLYHYKIEVPLEVESEYYTHWGSN